MAEEGKLIVKRIGDAVDEISAYKANKAKILEGLSRLDNDLNSSKISKDDYEKGKQKYLQGKTRDDIIRSHDIYLGQLFDEIAKEADKALMLYGLSEVKADQKVHMVVSKDRLDGLGAKEKEAFMKEVNIDRYFLDLYLKRKKKRKETEVRVEYELYKPTEFGAYANKLFEKYTEMLVKKYPGLFEPLYNSLRLSGMKVLSKTYISIIMLVGCMSFMGIALFLSMIWNHPVIAIQIIRGLSIGIIGGIIGMVVAYMYPLSMAGEKEKGIKSDLPFLIIHLASVAGSGAKPISMFKTVLSSGQYPGIRGEVKKIVNYVTLFGYDLSTALKAVAMRTPSLKFKDLLGGIVSTIESGGDMKEYLQAMADEAMVTYQLERKKYVDMIETYSDIYTSLLIAAPLLFFVTLAIIQSMGGNIGGVPVSTIAKVGTFGVIPAMNIGYMFFIDLITPK